jgi:hypothetical protein
LPIDESAPPSQINIHTFVEQATQSLPQPTTCNAETQTQPWDEAGNNRQIWINHIYSNWEALEKKCQESCAYKKQNKELKGIFLLIFDLAQKLLAARKPSCNYSLFLMERLTWFQIKSDKEGKPHAVLNPRDFVKTFAEASVMDQHLLCEAYFHNEAIPEN